MQTFLVNSYLFLRAWHERHAPCSGHLMTRLVEPPQGPRRVVLLLHFIETVRPGELGVTWEEVLRNPKKQSQIMPFLSWEPSQLLTSYRPPSPICTPFPLLPPRLSCSSSTELPVLSQTCHGLLPFFPAFLHPKNFAHPPDCLLNSLQSLFRCQLVPRPSLATLYGRVPYASSPPQNSLPCYLFLVCLP